MSDKQRTIQQNKAAHKYFSMMSDEMNKHGITQRLLFDSFKDMDTTKHSVKQAFQRVAYALCGTSETHKLTTKQITEVYEAFDFYISQRHGVRVEWPSNEPPLLENHRVT